VVTEVEPGETPEAWDVSSTEPLSIEEKLEQAIKTDNDHIIIRAWQAEYKQYEPAQRYIPRILEAQKRLAALEQLRNALKTNDDEEIVKSFDPILNGYPPVRPAEWQRLSEAVTLIFRSCSFGQKIDERWLQATLLHRFVNACRANNDREIIITFQAIDNAGYTTILQLTEHEIDQVERAKRRIAVHQQFQEALSNGYLRQISDAYELVLKSDVKLSLQEELHAELVLRFVYAFKMHVKDDEALVAAEEDIELVSAYEAIETSSYKHTLHLTTREQERVQRARQRMVHLQQIRSALADGKLRKIVDACAAAPLFNENQLHADELAKLQLAKRYIEALQANGNWPNHPAVVEIYQEITASPYSQEFYFAPQEMPDTPNKALWQDRLPPQDEVKLIAIVDSIPIYNQQFQRVYLIKQQYIRLRQGQSNLPRELWRWIQFQTRVLQDIQTLDESEQQKVSAQVLDDITNDFLIKKEISGLARLAVQELARRQQLLFADFKQRDGFSYHIFLQANHLVDEDVKEVLAIYARREFLTEDMLKRRQPPIDTWLKAQRQTLTISYPAEDTSEKQRGGKRRNPLKLIDWFGL
jgi:hypothetical protein